MKLFATTLVTVALGYVTNENCPSNYIDGEDESGCYDQVGKWSADQNSESLVLCKMANPQCLVVECSGTRMKASLRYDLFQTNDKHEESFGVQLQQGTRELLYNGKKKVMKKLVEGEECGFTVDEANQMIHLDWAYTTCENEMSPKIKTDEDTQTDDLIFTIALSSPGNSPGIKDIEFYVDTTVSAECKYPTDIILDSTAFWVNQEDTDASESDENKFADLFDCEFYNDDKYENEISDTNIVNMGQTIYGKASALLKMPDLVYTLTGVVVSDATNHVPNDKVKIFSEPKSFDVIGPVDGDGVVAMSPDVEAQWVNQSTGTAPTEPGSDILFSYLSFGFEDLSLQNKLKVECHIKVDKLETPCGEKANNSVQIWFHHDGDFFDSSAHGHLPGVYIDGELAWQKNGKTNDGQDSVATNVIPWSACGGELEFKQTDQDKNAVLLKKMDIRVCDRSDCGVDDSTTKCKGDCSIKSIIRLKSMNEDNVSELFYGVHDVTYIKLETGVSWSPVG